MMDWSGFYFSYGAYETQAGYENKSRLWFALASISFARLSEDIACHHLTPVSLLLNRTTLSSLRGHNLAL